VISEGMVSRKWRNCYHQNEVDWETKEYQYSTDPSIATWLWRPRGLIKMAQGPNY